MAKLVVFYSRAGENYFGGQYRSVTVGDTEKVAKMIAETVKGNLFKIEQKVHIPHITSAAPNRHWPIKRPISGRNW